MFIILYDILSRAALGRGRARTRSRPSRTVDFRNFIVFFRAETLAHWNPTSCQTNIHNEFVRIRDSQTENSKIEIMETDRKAVSW